MEYRRLGKTNLKASIIGLGTEYLYLIKNAKKRVVSVVHEAIDHGVNYFDIIFAFPQYRDNFGAAFKGRRDKIIINGHIGCAESNDRYRLSHDVSENEELFLDLLRRLQIDHVDILMIQMVNAYESYDRVMKPHGLMELAQRFKKEGKARYIGISGHKPPGVMRFIKDSCIDVLLFPINIAWDFVPGRKEVFEACQKNKIGLVAMKIYAGGRLFKEKKRISISPVQCINYALSQPGVCTTVPGVKNVRQLKSALAFLDAADEDKKYHSIIADLQEDLKGNCVYCNHCQPCPADINIGKTIWFVDKAICEMSSDPKAKYKNLQERRNFYYPGRLRISDTYFKKLTTKASACTECGVCIERCPFDVDIISKMKQAVELSSSS